MSERIKRIIDFIMDREPADLRNASLLQDELEDMGFTRLEIRQAFHMLDFGFDGADRGAARGARPGSRVLGEFEKHLLSTSAQGYLLGLLRRGWISELQLSAIIDAAAFEFSPPISLDEIRGLASRFAADLPDDDGPPDAARRDEAVH